MGTFGFDFTIQTAPQSPNWTTIVANAVGINNLCARYTGTTEYNSTLGEYIVASLGLNSNATGCTSYAVGAATISPNRFPGLSIATQLQTMAAAGIQENDRILIDGGANDFINAWELGTPLDTNKAQLLATDFIKAINDYVLSSPTKRVVVLNVPKITMTPTGYLFYEECVQKTGSAAICGEINTLVQESIQAYSQSIKTTLESSRVMVVDLYGILENPNATLGLALTNVTEPYCSNPVDWDLNIVACKPTQGKPYEPYLFADVLHPTPQVYASFANKIVIEAMKNRGWLY